MILDPADPRHARARERLRTELIIWLTTVNPSGRPQTSPVWFLWESDSSLLVYSRPDATKVRNVRLNHRVAFNLDGDGKGSDIVTLEGTAEPDEDVPPAHLVPAYLDKYRRAIGRLGMDPPGFARTYSRALRVRPTRARVF